MDTYILENILQKTVIQKEDKCKNLYGTLLYVSNNVEAIYSVVLRPELNDSHKDHIAQCLTHRS